MEVIDSTNAMISKLPPYTYEARHCKGDSGYRSSYLMFDANLVSK